MTEESFEKIDYRLRPAKVVERKLLTEALRHLSAFAPLKDYTYVGFGSVYFADFILFHRALGLVDLHSIERGVRHKDRFLYNKPYGYVEMHWGTASKRLPEIDWSKRAIVWLDYDKPLSTEYLSDIAKVVTNAQSGSVVLTTVDVDPKRLTDLWLDGLRDDLSEGSIPSTLTADALKGPKGPRLVWDVVDHEIREATRVRAKTTGPPDLEYRQVFNFVYNDGSKMTTIGGILLDGTDVPRYLSSGIAELPFARAGSSPLLLQVPKLTYKEMRALDRTVPRTAGSEPPPPGLPADTPDQYLSIYRYFPHFVEADF